MGNIANTMSEQLTEIEKMGFDYACDGIDPGKFKYQTEEEKEAFIKGYNKGLETMASIGTTEEPVLENQTRRM